MGLGPNTLRFFIEALLTQPLGSVRLDVNLGFFLHEDPTRNHDQLDFLSYGLAARWAVGSRWEIVAEVAGRAGRASRGRERGPRLAPARGTPAVACASTRRCVEVFLSEQGTWGGTVGLSWTIRPGS